MISRGSRSRVWLTSTPWEAGPRHDHGARLCHAPTVAALAQALGSGAMTNSMDDIVAHAQSVFIIGSNTTEQHPVLGMRLRRAAKERGLPIVVADPRRIPIVEAAALHLPLRPGTDIALLNALAHVLIANGWIDRARARALPRWYDEPPGGDPGLARARGGGGAPSRRRGAGGGGGWRARAVALAAGGRDGRGAGDRRHRAGHRVHGLPLRRGGGEPSDPCRARPGREDPRVQGVRGRRRAGRGPERRLRGATMTMGPVGKSAVTLVLLSYSPRHVAARPGPRRVPPHAPGLARSAVIPHYESEAGQ
ncbi:MAG TPA: hypothetical protein DCQ64_12320 [Candidatus Rokubacteria bacterium]|nr:hypothetical protein [Candidatus Rokubacteria bacterium]